MIPLLIIGAAVAGGSYLVAKSKKSGVMTPQRQVIYNAALEHEKDPANLKTLARAFRSEGLVAQADLLDKRAALRLLPDAVQEARRAVITEALASNDAGYVAAMAGEFDKVGASGAAHSLRQHASGLIEKARQDQGGE